MKEIYKYYIAVAALWLSITGLFAFFALGMFKLGFLCLFYIVVANEAVNAFKPIHIPLKITKGTQEHLDDYLEIEASQRDSRIDQFQAWFYLGLFITFLGIFS